MKFGDKIKCHRRKAKLTQVQLAEKANMSRSYIADIERNRYNPSIDTLIAIANALDINLSNLINDEDDNLYIPVIEEIDIQRELQKMIDGLNEKNGLAHFNGESIADMSQEDKEILISSLENSLRIAARLARHKSNSKKDIY